MPAANTIAIIPAAGFGTRLLPFTRYLPKEMMPLGNKPIIHYAIEEIKEAGIEKIILVTSRGKEAMVDYLLHHANLGLNENNLLVVNQEEQKGLGHAVLCAMPVIEKNILQVAVVAPDDVMVRRRPGQDLAVKQLCLASQADKNAMWVMVEKIKPADSKKYGLLKIINSHQQDGQMIHQADDLVEKPSIESAPSNIGIIARYVLPMAIFAALQTTKPGAGGEIQLTDGMKNLLPDHHFFGVEGDVVRLDTGNVDGLFDANYFHRYNAMPPKK